MGFYIGVIIIIGCVFGACSDVKTRNTNKIEPPKIRLDSQIYDFGQVEPRKQIEHTFQFENAGQNTLKIKEMKSSCSCTATLLSKDIISPKEKGQIKIAYNVPNARGKVVENIEVYFTGFNAPVVLTLTGTVSMSIVCSPDKIYFSRVRHGESPERSFKILGTGGNSLQIEKVTTSSEFLETQVLTALDSYDLISHTIKARLSPHTPKGNLAETVTVYTNISKRPTITIPVEAIVVGRIQIWPEKIFLGTVMRDERIVRALEIDPGVDSHFEISKVESSSEYLKAALTKQNGMKNRYRVKIHVSDKTPSGILREAFTIHNNHVEEPIINIEVYGIITAP